MCSLCVQYGHIRIDESYIYARAHQPAGIYITQSIRKYTLSLVGNLKQETPMFRDLLTTLMEGQRAKAEGTPFSHHVLPTSRTVVKGKLLTEFYSMRDDFVSMGYGLPPEAAAGSRRCDM
jgi:hypothetical protein